MIATVCLDAKIRLEDVGDRDVVKVWNQYILDVRIFKCGYYLI